MHQPTDSTQRNARIPVDPVSSMKIYKVELEVSQRGKRPGYEMILPAGIDKPILAQVDAEPP